MKRSLLIVAFFYFSQSLSAQYFQDWLTYLADTDTVVTPASFTHGIAVDSIGNSYVLTGFYRNNDCKIWKLNKYGLLEWVTRIPPTLPAINFIDATHIIASNDAVYYYSSYGVVKIDANGDHQWFDSTGVHNFQDGTLAFDAFGNIVVATFRNGTDTFAWVKKMTPYGQTIYNTPIGMSKIEFNFGIAIDLIGNVFYVATIHATLDTTTENIYKIDTLGNISWCNIYTGPTYNSNSVSRIRFDRYQNLVAIAEGADHSQLPVAFNILKRIDQNGNTLFEKGNLFSGAYVPNFLVQGDSIICTIGSTLKVLDTLGLLIHSKNYGSIGNPHIRQFENSFIVYGGISTIVAEQFDYHLQLLNQVVANAPGSFLEFGLADDLSMSVSCIQTSTALHNSIALHLCYNCEPNIEGYSYVDSNFNCADDVAEMKNTQRAIHLMPTNLYSYTDNQGRFGFIQPDSTYALTESLPPYWNHDCGDTIIVTLDSANLHSIGNIFGSVPQHGVHDKRVVVAPSSFNAGFTAHFMIDYSNVGTTIENGFISFVVHDSLTFIHSSPQFDSVSGRTYFWNFSNLELLEHRIIYLATTVSTLNNIGSMVSYSATVEPIAGDTTPQNNIDSGSVFVTGSYDPNDKGSKASNKNETGNLTDSSAITYTIHFQNTGNDTAHKVVVLDSLDTDLDISTLEVIAFSHAYEITLYNNRVLKFTFNNIALPDSGANQLLSNGFIVYTIQPKKNLLPGTQIDNTAAIYFDYNAGVRTNTVSDWIELNPTSIFKIQDKEQLHLFLFPNPSNNIVNVITDESMMGSSLNIFDITGRKMMTAQLTTSNAQLSTSSFANGVYLVSVENEKGKTTKRLVIQH